MEIKKTVRPATFSEVAVFKQTKKRTPPYGGVLFFGNYFEIRNANQMPRIAPAAPENKEIKLKEDTPKKAGT